MAKQFNLTANLQIRGPIGADAVIRSLNNKFKNVSATIDLKLGSTAKDIKRIEADFRRFNTTLGQTTEVATRATSALSGLASSLSTAKFSQVSSQINTAGTAITGLGTSFRKTTKDIDAATFSAAKFGKDSALALKRFAAFTIPTTFFFGITAGFASGVKSAIDFERELVRVGQTLGRPTSTINNLKSTITNLSTSLGVSSSKLANVSVILSQAGLNAKDTALALNVLAKTELSPSFDNMVDSANGLIAAMNQFDIPGEKLLDLFNSINEVSARYPVESGDIITAIQKTGGAFRAAGGDIEELIALFSSIRSTTRESADAIATGLKTISGRLQRTETVDALANIGVNLRDAEGNFVGIFQAFQKIGQALSSVSSQSEQFAEIVEQIGGLRQISRVIPAIQQYAKAQEILNVARQKGNSLDVAARRAQESLSVQIDRLRESFASLFRDILNNPFFKIVLKGFVDLSKSVINLADNLQPLIPILGGIGLAKLGASLSRVGEFGRGFVGFFSGKDEISSEDKLNSILLEREKIQARISKEKERAADKERRIIERSKKDELTAIKEKKAAERELERRRDKSIRLERQNRLDSQRATEVQQKLELERQKIAARTGTGATEGAAANAAVIQKNTASVLVLTKAIEALTAATVKDAGGTRRTRTSQAGGSSRQVFRDPQTGRIISRGEAQRIGNLTPGSGVIFAGPSGIAGEDIREVRRRDRAEQLRRQAETRPLQRPPTLLLPGPTTAPGLQIATGGGFAAIQEANRPRATANFLADQSFKLAEREIASRNFPFGKVVPRTTEAAIRPVTEFERIVSGALDNFKPRRQPSSFVSSNQIFITPSQLKTSVDELNAKAEAAAAKRARTSSIVKTGGIAAAIALPQILDTISGRDRDLLRASSLSVSTSQAIGITRKQAAIGAVGSGLSTGAAVGFALGPAGIPAAIGIGITAAIADFINSVDRLKTQAIEGRLAAALDATSSSLDRFAKGVKNLPEVTGDLVESGNRTTDAFKNVFESLPSISIAEATGSSILDTIFGGNRSTELFRQRRDEFSQGLQQAGSATAALASTAIGQIIDKLAAEGTSVNDIRNNAQIKRILSNAGVQEAFASTSSTGREALTSTSGIFFEEQDRLDEARSQGLSLAKKEVDERLKAITTQRNLDSQIAIAKKTELDILIETARVLNEFENKVERLNSSLQSISVNFSNQRERFNAVASIGQGVGRFGIGNINTDINSRDTGNIIRGFLGSRAANRFGEINALTKSVVPELVKQLGNVNTSSILRTTALNDLVVGTRPGLTTGSRENITFGDLLDKIAPEDAAKIRDSITGGKELRGDDLKNVVENIISDAGTTFKKSVEGKVNPELLLLQKALEQINSALPTFASNLDTISGIMDHSIDIQNRISDIEAQRAQNAARFRATSAGREFVPNVNEALGPVRQRLGGFAFESPQGIRDRAATTFSRITALQTELEKARRAEQVAPGTGAGRISEIIRELDPLNRSFRDARQALELLSRDTTELALKEQQLSKVVADREARESFNRNFAGASPIDQLKQALGVRTLVGAAQRGSFLNAKEAREGLSAASGLGDTFRINGEAIRTLIPRLLEASGLNFLPAGVTPEEGKLEAERDALLKRQVDALEKLKELDNIQIGELRLQNNATERLIISLNNLANEISTNNPVRRAGGGVIPGSGNSDSVHALLTPGEYVLRKDAVRRIGLGALNRLNGVQRFANGGQVLPGATTNNVILPSINTQQMLTAINQFSNSVNILSQSLANFVPDITFTGHHTVDVRILGAEVLTTIQPAIQELINNQITGSIRKLILDRFPESGPV